LLIYAADSVAATEILDTVATMGVAADKEEEEEEDDDDALEKLLFSKGTIFL